MESTLVEQGAYRETDEHREKLFHQQSICLAVYVHCSHLQGTYRETDEHREKLFQLQGMSVL